MRAYIKKLQSKEEIVRKQILVGSLVVSMAFVGVVWVYSLNDRFSNKELVDAGSETQQVKPFALFSNSVTNAYQNITASVGNFTLVKKEIEKEEAKQIDLIVVERPNTQ